MRKFVALSLLFVSTPAFSQDFLQFSPFSIENYGGRVINEGIRDELNRSTPDDASGESGFVSKANDVAILSYAPSKSRTRTNLQSFVNKTKANDPAGAEQMEQLFASSDVIGTIGLAMNNIGLNRNNAADAFTVYWISAWKASVGDKSTASPAAYQAASAQAARGLSSSAEFARASDAQKQEMAEALMIQAALIDAHMEAAAADPAQMKALSKAVKQGARASGLDLDSMTLTENGFVPAKEK